jgi:hypothetical protein
MKDAAKYRREVAGMRARSDAKINAQLNRDMQLTMTRPVPSMPRFRFLERPWPKSYTDAIPSRLAVAST